jgi:hypothetical protein
MIRAQQGKTIASLKRKEDWLKIQIGTTDPGDVDEIDKLEDQLSEIENKILRAEYDLNNDVELPLTEEEKGEWRQSQKAYSEISSKSDKVDQLEKKFKKQFTQLKAQLEADDKISESEDD